MSHEYYILDLLNIKDKNINLLDNFYKLERIDNITYKIIEAKLSYEPLYCSKCGYVFDKKNTYEVYQNILYALINKSYDRLKDALNTDNNNISSYMKTSIKTLKKYLPYIKNTLNNPYHNGFVEDNNNFIKVIKRIAFGFRSFRRFKSRIMICKNLLSMKKVSA